MPPFPPLNDELLRVLQQRAQGSPNLPTQLLEVLKAGMQPLAELGHYAQANERQALQQLLAKRQAEQLQAHTQLFEAQAGLAQAKTQAPWRFRAPPRPPSQKARTPAQIAQSLEGTLAKVRKQETGPTEDQKLLINELLDEWEERGQDPAPWIASIEADWKRFEQPEQFRLFAPNLPAVPAPTLRKVPGPSGAPLVTEGEEAKGLAEGRTAAGGRLIVRKGKWKRK